MQPSEREAERPTYFKGERNVRPDRRRRKRPTELAENSRFVREAFEGRCAVCPLIFAYLDAHPELAELIRRPECGRVADHVHHRRRQGPGNRKGGGHMRRNLIPTCWKGHAWVHAFENLAPARATGLLVLPGDPEFDELGAVRVAGTEHELAKIVTRPEALR